MTGQAETVGERIVRLAEAIPELPRTRKALAAVLGVEYETLRKWCAGVSAPNRTRATEVARLLRTTESMVMHGVATLADPGVSPRTALDTALEVVGAAIAALPAGSRGELGDLMRQWAAYGGKDLYRDLIAEMMGHGAGVDVKAVMRPLSPEAVRLAKAYDHAPAAGRALIHAAAQQAAAMATPGESPAAGALPDHTPG